jgi:dihydrofolate reductase
MISAIVAVDKDWGIGYQGQLLEHLPPDMKYFKELTMGNIVIMGRKTWDSLPVKPLVNRHNVIISKSIPETKLPQIITNREVPITFLQMDSLIQNWEKVKRFSNKEIFIIGGGEIYKQLLPYCDRVYVTLIEKSHDNVDTYFPNLNKDPEWEVSTCTELRDYGNIPYAFLTYDRIS